MSKFGFISLKGRFRRKAIQKLTQCQRHLFIDLSSDALPVFTVLIFFPQIPFNVIWIVHLIKIHFQEIKITDSAMWNFLSSNHWLWKNNLVREFVSVLVRILHEKDTCPLVLSCSIFAQFLWAVFLEKGSNAVESVLCHLKELLLTDSIWSSDTELQRQRIREFGYTFLNCPA